MQILKAHVCLDASNIENSLACDETAFGVVCDESCRVRQLRVGCPETAVGMGCELVEGRS